jgi:tetrathionate reductase subunit B
VAKLLKTKKTVRIVNQETDTDPVMYYIDQTEPMGWTVAATAPLPIQLWRYGAGPLLKGLVGLTGLGVLIMLGRQFFIKQDPLHSMDTDEKKAAGDDN